MMQLTGVASASRAATSATLALHHHSTARAQHQAPPAGSATALQAWAWALAQPQGWASHSRMRVHRAARLAPSGALLARTTLWMMITIMETVLVTIVTFLKLKPAPARSMQLQRRSSKVGVRLHA